MKTVRKRAENPKTSGSLEVFAKSRDLKAHNAEYEDPETGERRPYPEIKIGNALIIDPTDDPMAVDIYGSTSEFRKMIRDSSVKKPLMLILFLEQKNRLYDRIGFDIPSYENGGGSPEDPESSEWGSLLHRVGLRYFDGDDQSISFLFPSGDKAAVALALALARIR
jgi:hypothetical protein